MNADDDKHSEDAGPQVVSRGPTVLSQEKTSVNQMISQKLGNFDDQNEGSAQPIPNKLMPQMGRKLPQSRNSASSHSSQNNLKGGMGGDQPKQN